MQLCVVLDEVEERIGAETARRFELLGHHLWTLIDGNLRIVDLVARFCPWGGIAETDAEVQTDVVGKCFLGIRVCEERDGKRHGVARFNAFEKMYHAWRAEGFAILDILIGDVVVIERGVVIEVDNGESGECGLQYLFGSSFFRGTGNNPYGSIDLLDCAVFGCDASVAADNTIHAEGVEIGFVSKVTAVEDSILRNVGLVACGVEPLIHPVPYETAQHTRMAVYFLPITVEITNGIAHGVGIFGGKDRTIVRDAIEDAASEMVGTLSQTEETCPASNLGTFLICIFVHTWIEVSILCAWIETGNHIDGGRIGSIFRLGSGLLARQYVSLRSLTMHGACRVEVVEPCRNGSEVRAIATFVAHAPDDDGGMVLVAFGHTDSTIEEGSMPLGSGSQRATETMCLDASFVHDVESQTVAKLIPAGAIGIMAGAHCIDTCSLHEDDIFDHSFLGHHTAQFGIMLMTIHAAQTNGTPIDKETSMTNLNASESYLLLQLLADISQAVF